MTEKKKTKQKWTLRRTLPYILIVCGLIGLISSFVLTYDEMQILKNPDFVPNCNLNPVVSCGSVMMSPQGSVFGFPNSMMGLVTFAVPLTIGVAMLAGATFKRWFWLGLEFGAILGIAFAFWLLYASLYSIHAVCPYCLATDVAVITMFWYVTLYVIDNGYVQIPKGRASRGYAWIRRHHLDLLVLGFLLIAAWILKHFWYYYGQYF